MYQLLRSWAKVSIDAPMAPVGGTANVAARRQRSGWCATAP